MTEWIDLSRPFAELREARLQPEGLCKIYAAYLETRPLPDGPVDPDVVRVANHDPAEREPDRAYTWTDGRH